MNLFRRLVKLVLLYFINLIFISATIHHNDYFQQYVKYDIDVKLDIDYLREVRANGWQNLGQPLKSFRDSQVVFPQYAEGYDSEALQALGELKMPGKANTE